MIFLFGRDMKNLLKIQDQYIAALKNHVDRSVALLTSAKIAMGNYISDCKRCTPEKLCNECESWSKVWDDIDTYLEDNK